MRVSEPVEDYTSSSAADSDQEHLPSQESRSGSEDTASSSGSDSEEAQVIV